MPAQQERTMQAFAAFDRRARRPWLAVIRLEPDPGQFRGPLVWESAERYADWPTAQTAAEAELLRREEVVS